VVNEIKSMVRPFLAVSGWIVLMTLVVLSYTNNVPLPQWIIGLCLAPSAVYLTDRTIKKRKK